MNIEEQVSLLGDWMGKTSAGVPFTIMPEDLIEIRGTLTKLAAVYVAAKDIILDQDPWDSQWDILEAAIAEVEKDD